jgi:hypothetical protein
MELWGGAAQAAVALIFAVSAATKLRNPSAAVEGLRVLGIRARIDALVVAPLVVVELTVAILLLTLDGVAAVGPAILALAAFTAFLAYLARNAPETSCGCMGDVGSNEHMLGIARNVILLGLLVFAWLGGAEHSLVTVGVGAQLALLIIVSSEGFATLRALHALTARPGTA